MKNKVISILFIIITQTCLCQEVFTDIHNKRPGIFLGSLDNENGKIKVLEDGEILWKDLKSLEQTDLLSGKDFIENVFKNGLQFEAEGYEPFWEAIIKDNILKFTCDNGTVKEYPIIFYTDEYSLNPKMYVMFKNNNGDIFGMINYLGLFPVYDLQCEYNLLDEKSLYQFYIFINERIFRGCAVIDKE